MKDHEYHANAEEINRQRYWKDCAVVALEQCCKGMIPEAAARVSGEVADHMLTEFNKRFPRGNNGRR